MSIEMNKEIFAFQGAVSRKEHFWLQLEILSYSFSAMIIPGLIVISQLSNRRSGNTLLIIGYLFLGIIILTEMVLHFCAFWRRVRDIRGTQDNENYWIFSYLVLIGIFSTNLVMAAIYSVPLSLFVYYKRGVISDPENAIPLENIFYRIESEFTKLPLKKKNTVDGLVTVNSSKFKEDDLQEKLAKLRDLDELKVKGVLTEEEFQSEKKKVLGSV